MTSSLRAGLVCVGFWIAGSASAATRVDLVIDDPPPGRSVPWPITTGVPFPRGGLTDVGHCRLVDDTGRECPLQARVAATWDAERRSVRWLTIDFIAEPGRKYALEFGADVKANPGASALKIDDGKLVRVSTGALTVDFLAQGPAALGPIRVDLNGDGQIQDDEMVASGGVNGDHYAIDAAGQRASSAGDGQDRKITVEARGPVRACVRVDGFYTDPDGKRILAYRTRYHFFAGLGLIKVVDEFRVIGSTKGVTWRDVAFDLKLPDSPNRRVAVDADGSAGNQVVTVTPAAKPWSVSSYQTTFRHYGNLTCEGGVSETGPAGTKVHKQTEQVGEWLQAADDRAAVTGSLRWFWQQFPKEWEASADGLRLHLWSPRGGELDFGFDGVKRFFGAAGDKYLLNWKGVRAPQSPIENFFYFAGRAALERGDADGLGVNKHHDFYLHFAPSKQAAQGQEYGRLAGLPPLALASGTWNCGTDVFGPLAARPSNSPEEAIVDRLFDLKRYAQDTFGDYGWWLFGAGPHYSYQWDAETKRHYADPRRFEHHTYQKETQLWWCYVRSGERKFLDWALPSENHWVDIAVSHQPTRFHTEWRGGARNAATLPWPRGDWGIDCTVHFLRQHDNAEAWLRGQAQFWASYHRTLETTTLAYYLTGDERFNDVIDYWRAYWGELAGKTAASADWQPWHREQEWYRVAVEQKRAGTTTWAEMIRDYAPFTSGSRHQMTLFFNLATLYEHTWDPKIGQAAREYADAFLDAKHPIGVWRSQDNRGPVRADAPLLSHFWAPALWKYARASGDPRMPDILRRYYTACLDTDPFAADVGVYSNAQIGYGYYVTRDPRYLRAARIELDELKQYGEPLAKPEDLGERLYNPYAPIKSLRIGPGRRRDRNTGALRFLQGPDLSAACSHRDSQGRGSGHRGHAVGLRARAPLAGSRWQAGEGGSEVADGGVGHPAVRPDDGWFHRVSPSSIHPRRGAAGLVHPCATAGNGRPGTAWQQYLAREWHSTIGHSSESALAMAGAGWRGHATPGKRHRETAATHLGRRQADPRQGRADWPGRHAHGGGRRQDHAHRRQQQVPCLGSARRCARGAMLADRTGRPTVAGPEVRTVCGRVTDAGELPGERHLCGRPVRQGFAGPAGAGAAHGRPRQGRWLDAGHHRVLGQATVGRSAGDGAACHLPHQRAGRCVEPVEAAAQRVGPRRRGLAAAEA